MTQFTTERGRDGRWLTKNYEFTISWKKIKLKFENIYSFGAIHWTDDDHHSPFDRESLRSRAPTPTTINHMYSDGSNAFSFELICGGTMGQVRESAHISCTL